VTGGRSQHITGGKKKPPTTGGKSPKKNPRIKNVPGFCEGDKFRNSNPPIPIEKKNQREKKKENGATTVGITGPGQKARPKKKGGGGGKMSGGRKNGYGRLTRLGGGECLQTQTKTLLKGSREHFFLSVWDKEKEKRKKGRDRFLRKAQKKGGKNF